MGTAFNGEFVRMRIGDYFGEKQIFAKHKVRKFICCELIAVIYWSLNSMDSLNLL